MLLLELDKVVNVLLYGYGLQFDYEWATPYWTLLRFTLALLGGIGGLSVFSAIYIILTSRMSHGAKPYSLKTKPLSSELKPTPTYSAPPPEEKHEAKEESVVDIVALPIVCNKCGKVFTQPLCMFDFRSGKPRLVNVCPYCNTILSVSGNSKTK